MNTSIYPSAPSSSGRQGKSKAAKSALAVVLALLLAVGGTFAYTAFSQTYKNEARADLNPGGRLHDEYYLASLANNSVEGATNTKDVYVENFSSEATGAPIYVRVRFQEYMEIGSGAGLTTADNKASAIKNSKAGAQLGNSATWGIHEYNDKDTHHNYWTWKYGGQKYYIPTKNTDATSLDADHNGTYEGAAAGDTTYYDDYTPITSSTSGAKQTLTASVMTMKEWKEAGSVPGDFWVYDETGTTDTTDGKDGNKGWFYWASPLQPQTATGLLLDEVSPAANVGDSWYYGIDVVGQFVSKNCWNGTTFGDSTAPENSGVMTDDARLLLDKAAAKEDEKFGVYTINVKGNNDATSVPAGTSLASIATVTKDGAEVDAGVTYSLTGATQAGTTIDAKTGLLTVDAAETPGAELTVTATTTTAINNVSSEYKVTVGEAADWKTALKNAMTANESYAKYNSSNTAAKVNIEGTSYYKLAQDGAKSLVVTAACIAGWPGGTWLRDGVTTYQWGTSRVRDWLNNEGEFAAVVDDPSTADVDETKVASGYLATLPEAVAGAIQSTTIETQSAYNTRETQKSTDRLFLLTMSDVTGMYSEPDLLGGASGSSLIPTQPGITKFYTYGDADLVPDDVQLAIYSTNLVSDGAGQPGFFSRSPYMRVNGVNLLSWKGAHGGGYDVGREDACSKWGYAPAMWLDHSVS